MRKIILNLATSFDRLIEGPNGELDWLVRDPAVDFGEILQDILSDKDIIFYGRVSYEKWGWFQPGEEGGPVLKEAYKLLHSKQKYVFSTTMTADDTNALFIKENIRERVREIQRQSGGNIWLYGGARLITTFLNLDLVDEYRLAVHPVILGKGKPLFEHIEGRHRLTLVDMKTYPTGVILETYRTLRNA